MRIQAPGRRHDAARVAGMLLATCCTIAHAGPPFQTDDPEPVDRGRTEVNLAAQGTRSDSGRAGTLAADINYGCARELQCHLALPLAFDSTPTGGPQRGLGDVEVGMKYRFFHSANDTWTAAIYPTLFLPTGDASRGLGNGRAQVLLPLWVQRSDGPWTWDAGAGYLLNRAASARNSWYFGLLTQRALNERLSVGAEVFHRTALAQGETSTSGFNLGATMKVSEHRNLLVSVGRGLQGVDADRLSFYAACQLEL